MLLWLEDLYVLKNRFFNFPSNFTWQFLLKIEHLYSIKSSLKFSYSKKKKFTILIFGSRSSTIFIIMSVFTFNSMNSFRKIIDKI